MSTGGLTLPSPNLTEPMLTNKSRGFILVIELENSTQKIEALS